VGLFPGAGGTQRVPRLCAPNDALQLMMTGENLTTERALSLRLVHEIVAADQLIMVAKQKLKAGIDPIALWDKAEQARAVLGERTQPHIAALVTCVNEGGLLPFDQALRVEQRHFSHLLAQPATRMMVRSLFISPQELNKGARRPRHIEAQKLTKIAIIGANEAIAHASAQAGLSVVVISSDYTQLHDCDLVIEAVCDDLALKQNVIEKATHFMPDHAILLSTTSGLADVLPHSHHCVGIHFCNEAVVEIIKGKHTSDRAVAVAFDYARLIKKTPLIIKDAPGFYINRCRERYISEARHMLNEGVPRVMIDAAAKMAGLLIEPLLNLKYTNAASQHLDVHELCLRFLTALALEAARVMEEGVVEDAREADVGSILAFGFPSFTGGVLSYIDGMGAAAFIAQCERLQQKFGARFEPNELLCDMARKNSGFYG
jgi:3-hydroxyacyl-CoA dehydrogenase / enoyl-CoA hydratase / 3-hydroxybutyryl-CoA epimerase